MLSEVESSCNIVRLRAWSSSFLFSGDVISVSTFCNGCKL